MQAHFGGLFTLWFLQFVPFNMRKIAFIFLFIFSSSSFAGWPAYGWTHYGSGCADWAAGGNIQVYKDTGTQCLAFDDVDGTESPCSGNDTWSNADGACVSGGLAAGEEKVMEHDRGEFDNDQYGYAPPPKIADSDGNVWEYDGVSNCYGDDCFANYTSTGEQVDYTDPSSWPNDVTGAPNSGDPTNDNYLPPDAFRNPVDPNTDPLDPSTPSVDPSTVAKEVQNKSSTTNNPDGSQTTNTKKTELTGSGTQQTTETTTTTNPDGSSVTSTKITTGHPDGSSTSSTSTTTDDGQGGVSTSITGTTTDDGKEEAEDSGSASGGNGCDAPPQCKGDAIACATLIQQWRTRCGLIEEISDTFASDLQTNADTSVGTVLDGLTSSIQTELDNSDSGIGISTGLKNKLNQIFPTVSSCSDITIAFPKQTMTLTCSRTQPLRNILFWVVNILTLFAVWSIATKSSEPK